MENTIAKTIDQASNSHTTTLGRLTSERLHRLKLKKKLKNYEPHRSVSKWVEVVNRLGCLGPRKKLKVVKIKAKGSQRTQLILNRGGSSVPTIKGMPKHFSYSSMVRLAYLGVHNTKALARMWGVAQSTISRALNATALAFVYTQDKLLNLHCTLSFCLPSSGHNF